MFFFKYDFCTKNDSKIVIFEVWKMRFLKKKCKIGLLRLNIGDFVGVRSDPSRVECVVAVQNRDQGVVLENFLKI